MKKKIGEIYNTPIVIGNKNEITKNEIHVDELLTSGESESKELKRNDVNFFDYDGTLLYAYTWEEAKKLTKLPPLPTHENLEVREWNYTLEDIKAQGVNIIEADGDQYNENTIKEIEIEGEVYKGALYIDDFSYEGKNITIIITKGNFEKGSLCYFANNSTGEWIIDRQDDGTPYEDYVDNVFNTIGKADIGACCYNKNGEQVMTNGTFIIERGVTSLDSSTVHPGYRSMAKVMSIPATVTYVYSTAFSDFIIEHLIMPINIEYEFYYNSAFSPNVTDSIWVNGSDLNTNIIDCVHGLTTLHIPPTFGTLQHGGGYFAESLIIYVPETIHTIKGFNFPGKHAYVIFDNHKFIPTLESNTSNSGGATFIVPDELYDVWKSSTNWSEFNDNLWEIRKLSEYQYLIK